MQRRGRLNAQLTTFQAIVVSWLAMKTWVKVWLFALNAVFIAAVLFWPEPLAKATILAYVASGPLLAAFMIGQRGLTRLLGIAHLVPWIPLALYVALRLTSDGLAGPRILPANDPALFAYAVLLLASLTVCLALDLWDVGRWFHGQRFRLGSNAAADAGASRIAPAPPCAPQAV
jgi:hypothetical protein